MKPRKQVPPRVDLGKRPPKRIVYLVHLDPPYKHAKHYLGKTNITVTRRDARHAAGQGARLLQVQAQAGGTWHVVRTWRGGDRKERQLKTRSGALYCPECHPDDWQPGTDPPKKSARYLTRSQRAAARQAREANRQKTGVEITGARELSPGELFPAPWTPTPEQEQATDAAVRLLEMQWQQEGHGMPVTEQDVRAAAREDAARVVGRQAADGWGVDRIINHHDVVSQELREAVTSQGKAYADEYTLAAVQLIGEMEREPEPEPMPRVNPAPAQLAPVAAGLAEGTPHPQLPGWQARSGIYQRAAAEQDQRQPA